MPVSLEGKLVVAISSRAVFDFEEENQVFERDDDAAYMALQRARLEQPATPGVAGALVRKLLAFDAPEAVQLSAQVLPVLRPGDRLQATLNGEPVTDWPPNAMVHVLQQPARGTYVVTFRVVSADGRTQCQSAARSFHVRQPSLIRPGPKR